jgi:hypothetical protein
MARSKSTPGSKANRANLAKEQAETGNPANLPDGTAVAAETAPTEITPGARIAPENRKFDVRKTDPRKNVVPINLEDEIRRRAYELYQQRGSGSGSETEDWLTAEREVRQRYQQQQQSA